MATLQEVIRGLEILQKYMVDKDEHLICAEHDVIYAGPALSELEGKISEKDEKSLLDAHWHKSKQGGSWAKFV